MPQTQHTPRPFQVWDTEEGRELHQVAGSYSTSVVLRLGHMLESFENFKENTND